MRATLTFLFAMGGLPFFKFYPADYLRDTRMLSCAAKGAWADILCVLHESPTRGITTLPLASWARLIGETPEQAGVLISEIGKLCVGEVEAHGNGDVTLKCRRMLRDSITREQTRLRVQRHRGNIGSNGYGNGEITGKKPEARSQKLESEGESLRSSPLAAPAAPAPAGGDGLLPLGPVDTNPATDPVAMTFPTVGHLSEWPLRQSKVDEWKAAYPAVEVDGALRELRQWCIDNPTRRKTANGMTRFLSSRLAVRQNRSSTGQGPRDGGRKAAFA